MAPATSGDLTFRPVAPEQSGQQDQEIGSTPVVEARDQVIESISAQRTQEAPTPPPPQRPMIPHHAGDDEDRSYMAFDSNDQRLLEDVPPHWAPRRRS